MTKRWLVMAFLGVSSLSLGAEPLMDSLVLEEEVSAPFESPLNFALELGYFPARAPGLVGDQVGNGAAANLEWLPLSNRFGKPALGVAVGAGLIKAPAEEGGGSVSVVPVGLYFAYRLDFLDDQILVPFAKVARSRTFFRDGIHDTRGTYDSWDYTLGVELCLDAIDRRSSRQLDASTGINNTYLVVEFMKSIGNRGSAQANLAREEWHASLRFEM